jgi:hypothetical protein
VRSLKETDLGSDRRLLRGRGLRGQRRRAQEGEGAPHLAKRGSARGEERERRLREREVENANARGVCV